MKTITITVSQAGETAIKTEGFTGNSCRVETAAIERALGVTTSDKPTAEASQHEQPIQTQNRS